MNEKVKVSCLQCGATNAYPVPDGGKTVVCGRCKTALPKPGQVLEPQADKVVGLIQNAALPILLDFYSPTCMPCHMMHPVLDGLAKRRAGDLMILRVNSDRNLELASEFRIKAVPTFVVMKKGFEIGRMSGALNETDFSLWVASKA